MSCPYDIPESLPPVLMLLADHLHDPVPIPATVKKVFQVQYPVQQYRQNIFFCRTSREPTRTTGRSTSRRSPRTSWPSSLTSSSRPATMPNASASVESLDCLTFLYRTNGIMSIVLLCAHIRDKVGPVNIGPDQIYSFSNFAPALWPILCNYPKIYLFVVEHCDVTTNPFSLNCDIHMFQSYLLG